MFKPFWKIELHNRDVVRGGAEWALAHPEFVVSEIKIERETATSISPLTTSLHNFVNWHELVSLTLLMH